MSPRMGIVALAVFIFLLMLESLRQLSRPRQHPILVVFRPWQRICDRFFKSRSALPFICRAALAVRADLIHGCVNLDLVTIRVIKFDARVAPRTAPTLVKNFHS